MDMKPFGIINIFLVALSVVLAPRAAAQTDTVAIVSEKGEDCYAAAAIKNGEGCLKYADTQGMFLCDSSLVMTGAYMKWQKVDAGVAGGFMLLAGNAGYVTVGGSDGRVNMIEFAGEEEREKRHGFLFRGKNTCGRQKLLSRAYISHVLSRKCDNRRLGRKSL